MSRVLANGRAMPRSLGRLGRREGAGGASRRVASRRRGDHCNAAAVPKLVQNSESDRRLKDAKSGVAGKGLR